MTNVQLYLAVGVPIVAILVSLTISMLQISGIREDMRGLRGEFAELRKDTNTAIAEMRREAREDRLQIAADIKLLTGKIFEIDTRLTRIEERLDLSH